MFQQSQIKCQTRGPAWTLPPQALHLVSVLQHLLGSGMTQPLHTEVLSGPLPTWTPTGKGEYTLTHTRPRQSALRVLLTTQIPHKLQVSLSFPMQEALSGSSTIGPKPYPTCNQLQDPKSHRAMGYQDRPWTSDYLHRGTGFQRTDLQGDRLWYWLPAETHGLISPA